MLKRSKPLQRRAPLRATPNAEAKVKPQGMRKCKVCAEPFRPARGIQTWCSPECGVKLAARLVEKKDAKAAADDKRKTRAQLEAMKTVPQLKKEAQAAFNRYVRLRDAEQPCICCGRSLYLTVATNEDGIEDESLGVWSNGGQYDCGHYRSTGAADHLRFNEDNAHAQRKRCNQWLAGNAVEYRAGLIARIGLERVEALEANHTPVKWTRDGLRAIRDEYRAKARQLEKESQ